MILSDDEIMEAIERGHVVIDYRGFEDDNIRVE